MRRVLPVGAVLLLSVALLAGCSASGGDAETDCVREASTFGSYADATEGSGAVDQVEDVKVTSVTTRPDAEDAQEVSGTARVRVGDAWTEVTWTCLSQADSSGRYSALISWTP